MRAIDLFAGAGWFSEGARMRMLQVSEAKAAGGLRADYALPPTHKDAMHMLGNIVCPPVAADIVRALRAAA